MGEHDDNTVVVQRYQGSTNTAKPTRENFSMDPATIPENHDKFTKVSRGLAGYNSTDYKHLDLEMIFSREDNIPKGPWVIREEGAWTVVLLSEGKIICKINAEQQEVAFDIATYINHARQVIPKLCKELTKQIAINKRLTKK